ncbi:hypothetical protein D9M71_768630 [compost metagenome]
MGDAGSKLADGAQAGAFVELLLGLLDDLDLLLDAPLQLCGERLVARLGGLQSGMLALQLREAGFAGVVVQVGGQAVLADVEQYELQ